ncbi:MAG: Mut7-C RNAse domain-containing protein, partial [Spirochaetes bacterium]|nr:Mut7-C RNAse domain-containing protein [Spirochaetota bacterium]
DVYKRQVGESLFIVNRTVYRVHCSLAMDKQGRSPSLPPSFILDVHLGKLARYLRLLGFDVAYANHWNDPEIVHRALKEHRTILTRDRGLLQRKAVLSGYLVQSLQPEDQLQEVLEHFHLRRQLKPYSRCPVCGTPIRPVLKEAVLSLLPSRVAQRYRKFYQCPTCSKVYWRGDHFRNLDSLVRLARNQKTGSST